MKNKYQLAIVLDKQLEARWKCGEGPYVGSPTCRRTAEYIRERFSLGESVESLADDYDLTPRAVALIVTVS